MSGNPAQLLSPREIIESWKELLPGFKYTHHQVGNFLVNVEKDRAHVFCCETATHYLEEDKGNIWTVVGTYDFDFIKSDEEWHVSKMRFNHKYQDGNLELPQKAMEVVKLSK